jgi:arabinose-5-phosphate isomerase
MNNIIQFAKEVIEIESREIGKLSNLLTNDFENAVNSILNSKGKFIISGMGKSGIIGKKIAATLASTGTPSFFLHPGEAYHGDLGMVEKEDVLLLISNSGETDEVLKLIPFLKNQGNITISMTGNLKSTLAINTNFHINISVDEEACPLQLAPTSSTTATLVMGDAIAVVLMKLRGFKDENFAKFHPGGSLGRRLLTKVEDVMKKDYLPIVEKSDTIKNIINSITTGKVGLAIVLEDGKICGVITDGDIRRAMENREESFFDLKSFDIMSSNPYKIRSNEKLIKAHELMSEKKINTLVVIDNEDKLVGIVQLFDIN